jgi:hypothetical protein
MQEAARAGQLVLNDFLNPAVPCDSLTYLDDIQVQSDAGGLQLHHVDLQVDSWLDIQHVEAEVNARLLHSMTFIFSSMAGCCTSTLSSMFSSAASCRREHAATQVQHT